MAGIQSPIALVELVESAIDPARLGTAPPPQDCGAELVFLGLVRNHHQQRAVARLRYDAYHPMALQELERSARTVCERWPEVRNLRLVHRLGLLELGEVSLYASLASPHRGSSFAALSELIELLKANVPIWKQEIYADNHQEVWRH